MSSTVRVVILVAVILVVVGGVYYVKKDKPDVAVDASGKETGVFTPPPAPRPNEPVSVTNPGFVPGRGPTPTGAPTPSVNVVPPSIPKSLTFGVSAAGGFKH